MLLELLALDVFPPPWQAPLALYMSEANCGPIVAWAVLRYFHKRTAAARLIRACLHSGQDGTHAIAMAVALREHGLRVDFYSDPDPAPAAEERQCYRRAEEIGVQLHAAADLGHILAQVGSGRVAVVLYNTDEGTGHFSPIAPARDGLVYLPYAESKQNETMSEDEFERRWTAPGVLRECLLVNR